MSSWARVKVLVKNVELFKECCKKHNVSFELNQDKNMMMQRMPVHAILRDEVGSSMHSMAYLCAKANEGYVPMVDNDPHYSSLTARLGPNLGPIGRDYTQRMLRKSIMAQGGMVNSVQEQKDKWLLMRVSVP